MDDLENLIAMESNQSKPSTKTKSTRVDYIDDILNMTKGSLQRSDVAFNAAYRRQLERNTIDAVYTSLSSETLRKVKKDTLKNTYKRTLSFYQDFDSEGFCLCQPNRSEKIQKTIDDHRVSEAVRPRTIESFYAASIKKAKNKATYVLGKLSQMITLFFTQTDKEVLLKAFGELREELSEKDEERRMIKASIFTSTEKNFDMLLTLINNTQNRAEFLFELVRCLPFIESRLFLFKLLSELSKTEEKLIYEDKSVSFFNIKKLFNFLCDKPSVEIQKEGDAEAKQLAQETSTYLGQSTEDNQIVKVVNHKQCAYFLVSCVTGKVSNDQQPVQGQGEQRHLIMIAKALYLKNIRLIKAVGISQRNDLHKVNVMVKEDSLIWVIAFSGKVIEVTVLDTATFEIFKQEKIEVEEELSQIYSDKKRLYAIFQNGKRMFSFKLNLSLSNKKYYSLTIEQEGDKGLNLLNPCELFMKDSITINDLILLESQKGFKAYARFSLNKSSSNAIFHILSTNSQSSPDQLYSYCNQDNTLLCASKNHLSIEQLSVHDGFLALPYDYHHGQQSKSATAYEFLINSYAKYISIAGNYNMIDVDSLNQYNLIQNPLVLVEDEEFSFILHQMLSSNLSFPLLLSYFIIIKQYTNTIFNVNKEKTISANKDLESKIGELKQFIRRFITAYPSSSCPNKRLILHQIKEIEANLSINSMSLEELQPLIQQCKTSSLKLSLLQLAFNKKNLSNSVLYQIIGEIEVDCFNESTADYELHYDYITSIMKQITEAFGKCNFDASIGEYLQMFYKCIKAIADKMSDVAFDDYQKQLRHFMIRNSFLFKACFFLIQNMIIKKSNSIELKASLPLLLNLLIKLQLIDSHISIPNGHQETIYDIHYASPKVKTKTLTICFDKPTDLLVKHSPKCSERNDDLERDCFSLTYSPLFENTSKLQYTDKDGETVSYKAQLSSPNASRVLQNDLMNSIELSIVHYILSIPRLEKLNSKPKSNADLDKKLMPFYYSKLLQFISLNDSASCNGNENSINIQTLLSALELSNQSVVSLFSTYLSKESIIENTKNSIASIDYTSSPVDSAIHNLNKALSMKNAILSSLGGSQLLPVIVKLFSVIVKFHGLNSKFQSFVTEINAAPNNSWHTIANYEIFYSIWAECSQIRIWFSELRSQIADSEVIEEQNFDNEIMKQLNMISTKAQFINEIIFPSPYEVSTFSKESVIKLIEILKSNEFGIDEIKTQSKEQNAKSAVKTNHLNLINVLLAISSKESILNYILYHLNTHFRTEKKKLVSFVDDLLGADYLSIDKVKNQFHLLLDILKEKITSPLFNAMSKNTKMNLYQSLIWKIKGRDFYIFNRLCCVITPLRTCPLLLADNSEDTAGLTVLSDVTVHQRLFEFFKVFTIQVFKRIKTTTAFQVKDTLSLSKKTSKIAEEDEKQIINYIVEFYMDLSESNPNFKAFLLHLYQCLVNERDLIILVLNNCPLLLMKVIRILQANRNESEVAFDVKLLLIKLLEQLLANADDATRVDADLLLGVCNMKENENAEKDPYEVLFTLVFELFTSEMNVLLKKEYEVIIQMFISNEQFASFCNEKLMAIISKGHLLQLIGLFGVDVNPFRYSKKILQTNPTTELLEDEKNNPNCYILAFNSDESNLSGDKLLPSSYYHSKSNKDLYLYIEENPLELQGVPNLKQSKMPYLVLAEENIKEPIRKFLELNREIVVKEALKLLNASSICTRDKYLLMKFLYCNLSALKINSMEEFLKTISVVMADNLNKSFCFTSLEVLENNFLYLLESPSYSTLNDKGVEEPNGIYDLLTYTVNITTNTFIIENKLNVMKWKCTLNNFNGIKANLVTRTVSFYNKESAQLLWNEAPTSGMHFVFVESLKDDFIALIKSNGYKEKCGCLITTKADELTEKTVIPYILLPKAAFDGIENFLLQLNESTAEMNSFFFNNYIQYSSNSCSDKKKEAKQQEEEKDDSLTDLFNLDEVPKAPVAPKKKWLSYDKATHKMLLKKVQSIQDECMKKMLELITRRVLIRSITLKYISDEQFASYFKGTSVISIYRLISSEFYLNTTYSNVSNTQIKQLLRSFLESLSNDKLSIGIINLFFTSPLFNKIDFFTNSNSSSIANWKINNKPIEQKMLSSSKESFDMAYSAISFILNKTMVFDQSNAKEVKFFLATFFDKVNSLSKRVYQSNKSLSEFMLNLMTRMYNEIISNKPNKGVYIEFFKEYNLSPLISSMIAYIDIDKFLKAISETAPKAKAYTDLIQFIFKYYDVTFWLFINLGIDLNVRNWITNDILFNQFYYQYHLLSLGKTQEAHELKISLMQTVNGFGLMNILKSGKEMIKEDDRVVKEQASYELKLNNAIDIALKEKRLVKIEKEGKGADNAKLVSFIRKDENIIILQDVIDGSYLKSHRHYSTIYFFQNVSVGYLNHIKTRLYAFGSNYSHSLGINGEIGIDYTNPQECKGLSNSTWQFNYGYYYAIALDDNGTAFSCGANSGAGLNSRSIKQFTEANRINQCELLRNNIEAFACGNSNATLILSKDNKLYAIGKNESNMLSQSIVKKSKVPALISQPPIQAKIVQISLGYKNSFAITEDGKGFALGSNSKNQINEEKVAEFSTWVEFKLPPELKGFVSSACGEEFYLFLIESNDNTVELYSSGSNDRKACGVLEAAKTHFNKCDYPKNIYFKSISCRNSACAAISLTGSLYVWGTCYFNNSTKTQAISYPKYVDTEKKLIFDEVSISESHLIALVREKKGGLYTKAVYATGNNSHGALGIPLTDVDKEDIMLRKVSFFSSMEDTPVKVATGYDHSYVLTVNSNEITSQLNSNVIFKEEEAGRVTVKVTQQELSFNNELVSFYQSSTFSELEEAIKQIGHNMIQEFQELLEEIMANNQIKMNELSYETFKKEISAPSKAMLQLSGIFSSAIIKERISQAIFTYLYTKIQLINTTMIKFNEKNKELEDTAFLNNAIKNNLHFLSSETRIKNFNKSLSTLRSKCKHKRIHCKVNRFNASEFYEKKIADFELKETVFGQVYQEIHKTEKECYYLEQLERLFVVDFVREGATDQGGPYHDVFTAIADELQSHSLDLFIKSPNNRVNIGTMRDKYVINTQAILPMHFNAFEFLGKLFALSIFTGECLNLNIHPIIWKLLFGTKILFNEFDSVDFLFVKLITEIENTHCQTNEEFVKQFDLTFTIQNSNGNDIELKKGGAKLKVTFDNKAEFIALAKQRRIKEFDFQIQFLKKGLNDIINESYLEILSARELNELICGKPKLNLELLKKRTSYSGYNKEDEIIGWFWETLEEFTEQEKLLYLKFVWGRSRLPSESCQFSHTVSKISNPSQLPQSSTCFCKLVLPKYTTKEMLQSKLRYVIANCNEIDADY